MPPPNGFVELCEAAQVGKLSNVIGTVIDALPSTVTRKGDYMLTFTLDDGTLQNGLKCRLFARKAQDLPQINGLGDVLILKRAKYNFIQGSGLLSTTFGNQCPWAVFHSPIPKDLGIFGALPKAARFQIQEITKEEMQYVISLGQTQDRSKFTPLNDEVKAKVANIRQRKTCYIKDLMLDSYPQIVGEVVKVFFNYERATLYITDYTENQFLYNYEAKSQKVGDGVEQSKWPGPPGKYTLQVECWPPHSEWIRENVSVGTFLQLENVHIKSNREHGRVEGALHTSKHNEDQLRVRKIETRDAAELLLRKEQLGWADGFDKRDSESDEENPNDDQDGKTGKTKDSKNRRKRKKKQQAEQDLKRPRSEPIERPVLQPETPSPAPCLPADLPNENVQCEERAYRHKTVAEIREMPSLTRPPSTDNQEELKELASYATLRVVDFKPERLEDFARARDMTEAEQREAGDANLSDAETQDIETASQRSANSLYNGSTQKRRQIWEWKFVLLLEDASASTTCSEDKSKASNDHQLIAYISNTDAEYLLNMKALDLRNNPQTLNRLRETLFILWGDLEENKERQAARVLGEISANASSAATSNSSQNAGVRSRPFKCIIEEYGEEFRGTIKRKFTIKGTTIRLASSSEKQVEKRVELDSWDDIDGNDIDGATQKAKTEAIPVRAPRAG